MASREDNDLYFGSPDQASRADEERGRCSICGGRYLDGGECERCGVLRDEADDLIAPSGSGRYEVLITQQDGNPRPVASCDTLRAALRLEELLHPYARRLHGVVGTVDEQDGERGWLNELSWDADRDAGPDPCSAP